MSLPRPPAPHPVVPEPSGPVELTLTERLPGTPGSDDSKARRAGARRPPRHLADLPLAERRAAVAELGEPTFRANQLSRHFFGRLHRLTG